MSINEYVAGGLGGVAGVIIGHPFDTAKIQMQIRTAGEHNLSKSSHAFLSVAAQGLKRGLFRGMLFPVASYGFVNSLFFGVYGNVLKLFPTEHDHTNLQVYLAGCFAGTVQLILACPVEVIKCTMQAQIPLTMPKDASALLKQPVMPRKYYTGPFHCIRDVLRLEGIQGLYKGLFSMFLRDVPSYGLYLLVYEMLFRYLNQSGYFDKKGIVSAIIAGGISGSVTWFSIMPLDVIKSRLQIDHGGRYKGFLDCLIQSVRNGGFSVLFRGTVITVVRAFPVNSVTFLVYSQLLQKLDETNPPQHRDRGKDSNNNSNSNNSVDLIQDNDSIHYVDNLYHEHYQLHLSHFVPVSHAFPFLYEVHHL